MNLRIFNAKRPISVVHNYILTYYYEKPCDTLTINTPKAYICDNTEGTFTLPEHLISPLVFIEVHVVWHLCLLISCYSLVRSNRKTRDCALFKTSF